MMLDDWEWFIELAEQESFTKASELLQISQQTLSARLNALERALDVKLITRGNPLRLTQAGMIFLLYAREQQQSQEDMIRQIGEVTGSGAGTLKIAISHLRSRTLMPYVIERVREKLPNVTIQLVEGTNRELLRMTERGEVDASIARFDDIHPGVEVYPIYEEEIVLALTEGLLEEVTGEKKEAAVQDIQDNGLGLLENCPFILESLDDIAGRVAYSVLRNSGIRPKVVAMSESIDSIYSMVERGLGAAFFPTNALSASSGDHSSLVQILLSGHNRYTISLGVPIRSEQWLAVDILREALRDHLSSVDVAHAQ